MENKFVKKPTPKGDKSTRIVFIGLLVALLFIIAGTAIFFAVNSSSKATKGLAASSKSSKIGRASCRERVSSPV